MARIRTVKPQFFRHKKLFNAEQESGLPLRVAFAGLWTCADREGRFKWDADELKLDCLPYDQVDFSRVLDALVTRGFLVMYSVEGRLYGWIPGFTEHQVINNREADSKIPAFDPNVHKSQANSDVISSNVDALVTREPRVTILHEGKGREGKEEGKGTGTTRDRNFQHEHSSAVRIAIVKAFEEANSPNIPDTSMVDVWLSQGYSPDLIVAIVSEGVRKKPDIESLLYFKKQLAKAHEIKSEPKITVETDDDRFLRMLRHERETGEWIFKTPKSDIPQRVKDRFAVEISGFPDIPDFLQRTLGAA